MTRLLFGAGVAFSLLLAPVHRVHADEANVMTEAELAQTLVEVLGLSTLLPANPSDGEAFAILLANGISPRDGWNSEGVVTVGTLSRILVQAMGRADEIENPDNDNEWVALLAALGVEFGTVQDAIDQIDPIAFPEANVAIVVSTDPLRKSSMIGQGDDQQLGADLMELRRPLVAVPVDRDEIPEVIDRVTRPSRRPTPPPMTPWWFRR